MCKHLAELLRAEQPLFGVGIEQLERASGNPSADVRLTAEIIAKVHRKTKELGLDPNDTTGQELYNALLELVKLQDGFIAKRLGASDPTDVVDVLPRLKALIEQIDVPKSAWVLKHSVAKRLLKSMPPKRVMKQLHYRSIDSLLKREPMGEIFGAVRFAESAAWQEAFLQKYQKLTPSDFEMREIELIQMESERWASLTNPYVRKQHHNITHLKEMGVILILPLPVDRMPGLSITVLPFLLHYINEIRMYSAYFRLQQVSPNFGEILAETLINDPGNHAFMAGQQIHWRVIQRHFGSSERGDHPEIFEPHLQPEDLEWRKAEGVLYRIEPALHFWLNMDYVGTVIDGKLVSFNLMDMAVSYVNKLSFGQHVTYHFQDALWNEIFARYMGQTALERQILKQLDNKTTEPEVSLFNLQEAF